MTADKIVTCLLEDNWKGKRSAPQPAPQPAPRSSVVANKHAKRNHKFDKLCCALPGEIQNLAREVYNAWRTTPFAPELEFKKLQRNDAFWSIRIGRAYRAICYNADTMWIWCWIGTHEEYNKVLNQVASWKPPMLP